MQCRVLRRRPSWCCGWRAGQSPRAIWPWLVATGAGDRGRVRRCDGLHDVHDLDHLGPGCGQRSCHFAVALSRALAAAGVRRLACLGDRAVRHQGGDSPVRTARTSCRASPGSRWCSWSLWQHACLRGACLRRYPSPALMALLMTGRPADPAAAHTVAAMRGPWMRSRPSTPKRSSRRPRRRWSRELDIEPRGPRRAARAPGLDRPVGDLGRRGPRPRVGVRCPSSSRTPPTRPASTRRTRAALLADPDHRVLREPGAVDDDGPVPVGVPGGTPSRWCATSRSWQQGEWSVLARGEQTGAVQERRRRTAARCDAGEDVDDPGSRRARSIAVRFVPEASRRWAIDCSVVTGVQRHLLHADAGRDRVPTCRRRWPGGPLIVSAPGGRARAVRLTSRHGPSPSTAVVFSRSSRSR